RLKDISFTLRRGEILGIAGLMGAGRTELLECLFGASPEPPTGRILVEGREGKFSHPAEARQCGIALGTEDRKRPGLFADMDVGAKAELYRLMDRLCRDGLGIVVTSSELPELLTVSDRILVLCEGRLTGEFTRAEATEHRIMEAATARMTSE